MTVDQIVRVSFAGQPRAIHLPPDLIWYLPGTQSIYVKLVKYRSEICRLLGQPLAGKGKGRKLQYTSIIESLIKLRDDNVMTIVENIEKKGEHIDLEIDAAKKRRCRMADGKRTVSRWPQTPEILDKLPLVVDIVAPQVGEAAARTINVRVAKTAGLPLIVPLEQEIIEYLATAVQHQCNEGDIHRRRCSVDEVCRLDAPLYIAKSDQGL